MEIDQIETFIKTASINELHSFRKYLVEKGDNDKLVDLITFILNRVDKPS